MKDVIGRKADSGGAEFTFNTDAFLSDSAATSDPFVGKRSETPEEQPNTAAGLLAELNLHQPTSNSSWGMTTPVTYESNDSPFGSAGASTKFTSTLDSGFSMESKSGAENDGDDLSKLLNSIVDDQPSSQSSATIQPQGLFTKSSQWGTNYAPDSSSSSTLTHNSGSNHSSRNMSGYTVTGSSGPPPPSMPRSGAPAPSYKTGQPSYHSDPNSNAAGGGYRGPNHSPPMNPGFGFMGFPHHQYPHAQRMMGPSGSYGYGHQMMHPSPHMYRQPPPSVPRSAAPSSGTPFTGSVRVAGQTTSNPGSNNNSISGSTTSYPDHTPTSNVTTDPFLADDDRDATKTFRTKQLEEYLTTAPVTRQQPTVTPAASQPQPSMRPGQMQYQQQQQQQQQQQAASAVAEPAPVPPSTHSAGAGAAFGNPSGPTTPMKGQNNISGSSYGNTPTSPGAPGAFPSKAAQNTYKTYLFWDLETLLPKIVTDGGSKKRDTIQFYRAIADGLKQKDFLVKPAFLQSHAFVDSSSPKGVIAVSSDSLAQLRIQSEQLTVKRRTAEINAKIKSTVDQAISSKQQIKVVLLSSVAEYAEALTHCQSRNIPVCVIHGAAKNSDDESLFAFWSSESIRVDSLLGVDGYEARLTATSGVASAAASAAPVPRGPVGGQVIAGGRAGRH